MARQADPSLPSNFLVLRPKITRSNKHRHRHGNARRLPRPAVRPAIRSPLPQAGPPVPRSPLPRSGPEPPGAAGRQGARAPSQGGVSPTAPPAAPRPAALPPPAARERPTCPRPRAGRPPGRGPGPATPPPEAPRPADPATPPRGRVPAPVSARKEGVGRRPSALGARLRPDPLPAARTHLAGPAAGRGREQAARPPARRGPRPPARAPRRRAPRARRAPEAPGGGEAHVAAGRTDTEGGRGRGARREPRLRGVRGERAAWSGSVRHGARRRRRRRLLRPPVPSPLV